MKWQDHVWQTNYHFELRKWVNKHVSLNVELQLYKLFKIFFKSWNTQPEASQRLNTCNMRRSDKSICFVPLRERLYDTPILRKQISNISALKKISCCTHSLEHSCQTQTQRVDRVLCDWHKMVDVHHVVVKESRGSCAYVDSPGNVSLRAHGGWTACHRCHSWRSVRLSGWSGASWACADAWRCSYSGGTWAYWWLGVRPRLERDRNTRADLATRCDWTLYTIKDGQLWFVLTSLSWNNLDKLGNGNPTIIKT